MNRAVSFIVSFIFVGCISIKHYQESTISLQEQYSNVISERDIKKYVSYLASDELEGRKTGEKGQKSAAMYIATEFESYGLKPIVKDGNNLSYFQKFDIVTHKLEDATIKTGDKEYKDNFICPFGIDFEGNWRESDLVFVPNKETVNFKELKGKSILVAFGTEDMKGKRFFSNAINNGVKAIFFYLDNSMYSLYYKYKDNFNIVALGGKLEKMHYLPTFLINSSNDEMIKSLSGHSLSQLVEKAKGKNHLDLGKVEYSQKFSKTSLETENVLGYLEGTDKKDEVIILTAHYDHLGVKNGKVYNGADDNASGTSAIMSISKAFAKAKEDGHSPKRSFIFMAVSAEEMGLWGSKYYVNNPVLPLKNVVCNLNIDMIGRIGGDYDSTNYIYLIGSDKISQELHDINESVNSKYVNLELDYTYNREDDPNRFYYRSDHYNFAKNGIPIIFYFNGTHDDYHKHTDTKEKIHFGKIKKISKLVFHTAWEVANRENRLKLNK